MLLAVLLYGGYTVALRFKPAIGWKSLMLVMGSAALITALPFAIWEIASGNVIWPDARGWTVALYTAIGPAILAQVFYIKGVEALGSNRAGLFINMVPIFGTLLSILILGETFRPYHAIALALVMSGIWLSERRTTKKAASVS